MSLSSSQSNLNHTQAAHAQVEREKKRIVVGVDFGTSTTKVMYRPIELGAGTRLIIFAHGHPKFPPYVMPSSVRLDGEYKFWFGDIAEVGYGQVFRSFKVCVACQVNAIACRGCNQNNLEKKKPFGLFEDGMIGFISAHELMIYYLAWLLNIVDGAITYDQQGLFELGLQYNLGVPISHIAAKPELAERFEWILHTALALRGKIQQGILAAQARSYLIEALPDSILPPRTDRQHCAIPETSAVAMWLQKTINDDTANYMLIDIGAGTTDITIYRYAQVNPDTLPIYGANSIPVAGDNIDLSTIKWFAEKYGQEIKNPSLLSSALRQEVRHRKEFLPKPNRPLEAILGNRIIALDEQTYIEEIVRPHAESIYQAASETFRGAYQLARQESQWQEMKIVLLGGGSRIVGMRQYFKNCRLRNFMKQHLLEPCNPDNVDMACVNDFQLLAVAYGLAFPPAELLPPRPSNQIRPLLSYQPNQKAEYDENPMLNN
ncbi:MAG: Cell division protein FtsA [bacterium]|nr:Cell division protein FtsA [bacterium]